MAENLTTIISSEGTTVTIHRDAPTVIIGERINPTGRQSLQKAMVVGDWDIVRQDALDQLAAGAVVLDVNGIPPTAEQRLAVAAKIIQQATRLGIALAGIVIAPLVLTLGTDPNVAR